MATELEMLNKWMCPHCSKRITKFMPFEDNHYMRCMDCNVYFEVLNNGVITVNDADIAEKEYMEEVNKQNRELLGLS